MTPHDLFRDVFLRTAVGDRAALLELFAPDAVVTEDGCDHQGVDAIRLWWDAAPAARYRVLELAGDVDETMSALVDVTGGPAGSPTRLLFRIDLGAGGAITRLTIRPVGEPVQTIALLSARRGLAHAEFFDYYEHHHVPLIRTLAPVPMRYTRTYLPAADERSTPADFDVVTQLRFADLQAQQEWLHLVMAKGSGVAEDEARFLDRERTRSWTVQVSGHANWL